VFTLFIIWRAVRVIEEMVKYKKRPLLVFCWFNVNAICPFVNVIKNFYKLRNLSTYYFKPDTVVMSVFFFVHGKLLWHAELKY